MANPFLEGFAGAQAIAQKQIDNANKNRATAAFRAAYGDIGSDPEMALKFEELKQAQTNAPLKTQGLGIENQLRQQQISASKQNMDLTAQRERTAERGNNAGEIVSAAAFIDANLKRNPNADVGQLFDRVAPTLNLEPAAAAAIKQTLVNDPGAAGDLLTAFKLKQAATNGGDPASVKEWNYFQTLQPDQQAAFLRLKRANADPGIAGQIAGAQAGARQQAILTTAEPIAAAKAQGAATGKAQGEIAAEDLPASEAGKAKAQLAYEAAKQSFDVADDAITKATNETSGWSAGRFSHLPDWVNPQAAELRGDLTAISSKVVLDTISEMKNLSKTGATGLGQLSDREGQLIQAKLGAVLQASRPTVLKARLTDLQAQLALSRKRMDAAYAKSQERGQAPAGDALADPLGIR